ARTIRDGTAGLRSRLEILTEIELLPLDRNPVTGHGQDRVHVWWCGTKGGEQEKKGNGGHDSNSGQRHERATPATDRESRFRPSA
ncbi:MAG: hypothetical protein LQ341_006703, partial [Variospora aurantia]